eukprot:IDg18291t1
MSEAEEEDRHHLFIEQTVQSSTIRFRVQSVQGDGQSVRGSRHSAGVAATAGIVTGEAVLRSVVDCQENKAMEEEYFEESDWRAGILQGINTKPNLIWRAVTPLDLCEGNTESQS